MNIFKLICLTFRQMVKEVRQLPQTVEKAVKHQREQGVRDENEAERLDRIRNPSKYRGK